MRHTHLDLMVRWSKEVILKSALVDTGATFTTLPREMLENISGAKLPVKAPSEQGDGKIVEADAYAVRVGKGK